MRAIVLATGTGPRLGPITEAKPTAMVQVNGRPILDYALSGLHEAGIEQITVCTGYRADAIVAFCETRFGRSRIEFIENPEFSTSGTVDTLYRARERLVEGGLLLHGDVVCDSDVLRRLLRMGHSACAVDVGQYREASWKVVVENGRIRRLARAVPAPESLGCAVGVYKLLDADGGVLVRELESVIERDGRRDEEIEVVLDRLCGDGRLEMEPCDIGRSRWHAIDTIEDLLEAELLFNPKIEALASRRVVFLDRDGTLALSGRQLPGAQRFIAALRQRGARLFVMTNNSSKTRGQHLEGLLRCGVQVSEGEILLSTDVAAEYLIAAGLRRVYWVATDEVGEYLRSEHGLEFESAKPSAVLLTYDTTLDYGKLSVVTRHLQHGVRYFATHADLVCPDIDGPLPDVGTFIELLRLTTGRIPEMVFGKPHRSMVDAGLARTGGGYRDAVVIGDRLYTDIAVAEGTEMLSVLVLSGETSRAQYEAQERRADIVVRDLERLCQVLEGEPASASP